jgi:cell division protein FtsA
MTYYENIEKMLYDEFGKESKAMTNEYLGMKNSLNITSLAIAKEVSDRLYLLKEDTKREKEIEYLLNEKKEIEQPKVEQNNSIVRKIKKVLGDIF